MSRLSYLDIHHLKPISNYCYCFHCPSFKQNYVDKTNIYFNIIIIIYFNFLIGMNHFWQRSSLVLNARWMWILFIVICWKHDVTFRASLNVVHLRFDKFDKIVLTKLIKQKSFYLKKIASLVTETCLLNKWRVYYKRDVFCLDSQWGKEGRGGGALDFKWWW